MKITFTPHPPQVYYRHGITILNGVVLIKTNTETEDQFEEKLIKYLRSEEGREYLKKLAKE
ncbi:MAG: hypothetical protein WCK53_11140 [Methanomicrobiales archaeon]